MKARTMFAVALGLLALAIAPQGRAQVGNPGGAINDNLGEYDYGVCRGIDPKCFHDWKRAAGENKVLLYTRTAGPRHQNLGPALAPGLNPPLTDANVVQKGMLALAAENGFKLDYTEDVSVVTRLSGYKAVIFFSTSRDTLDDGAKTALRQYMRAGGGFVGIHNAFGTMYNWPYYEGLLGNANFYDHGPARQADVVIVNKADASTKGLPAKFSFNDEWYNLVPFPTKVRFLATVDEKTYGPVAPRGERPGPPPGTSPATAPGGGAPNAFGGPSVVGEHPGHGAFHPVTWCQYYDGGKSWVTTLGHDARAFSTDGSFAGAAEFRKMVAGGIKSVMGLEPFCQ